MYSLDVAVWKGKRSEKEAAIKKAKQQQSAYGDSLPRVAQDKKIKQIYGKTMCVDGWMDPVQSAFFRVCVCVAVC